MSPNQLPPLPSHDEHFMTCAHVYTADQMHAYALAALAQQAQAQEPVAWLHESGTLKLSKDMDEIRKGLDSWEPLVRPTTPPAPQPAPVDELIEALEDLMDWQVKNVALWHNRAYDRAHRAIKKHRAALQSPAPQTKGQP